MKRFIHFYLFLCLIIPSLVFAQQGEEFSGPFQSWANVKTRFGARGDGKR